MRELIGNSNLDLVLNEILIDYNLHSKEIKIAAEMQYKTGCRANDLLDASRWSLLWNGNLQLQPQKGNNIRLFEPLDVNDEFYDSILNNAFILDKLTYRAYSYYIELAMHKFDFMILSKMITTHLFRHNYAKKLHVAGFSDVDIQYKLGERRITSAQGYINSQITWIV